MRQFLVRFEGLALLVLLAGCFSGCGKGPVRPEAAGEDSRPVQEKGQPREGEKKAVASPPALGESFTVATSGTRMLRVEPGTFLMGSPEDEPGREPIETLHEVTLRGHFWLGAHEVTRLEWEKVMNPVEAPDPEDAPGDGNDDPPADPYSNVQRPRHPRLEVSWSEAVEFCLQLTAAEEESGHLPPGHAYTLPTEAQWEYACRAGTTTATAFGDALGPGDAAIDPQRPYGAVAKARIPKQINPVGKYKPNAWGFHDMHGNAAEWCRDFFFARYPEGPVEDPFHAQPTGLKVKRGGSFFLGGASARSAKRGSDSPNRKSDTLGFRIALVRE